MEIEISLDSPRNRISIDINSDEVGNKSVEKKEKSDSEDESPMIEIKLSRDPSAAISEYVKNDVFFKYGKWDDPLRVFSVTNRDDPNKTQIKVKSDKNSEVHVITNKNLHEFTTVISIKVFVLNYLGRVFELSIPFEVNQTFGKLVKEFQKIYETGPTAVIFKEKRLNSKEVDNFKFQKDFDFDKDYLVFVMDKFQNDLFMYDSTYNKAFRQKETRKCVIIFDKNVKVSAFYLGRGYYDSSHMVIPSFNIYEINESPQKYISKQKGAKNSRKSPKKCEIFNFDSVFGRKFDQKGEYEGSNVTLIYSAENIECENNVDDDEDRNDSFYGSLKKSYKHYPLPDELTFYKDRIYFFKCDVQSESTTRIVKFNKPKNTIYSKKGADMAFIFFEKKNYESVLAGIEFRNFTIFEN